MGKCRNCHNEVPLGKSVIYFLPSSHIRICHDCYDVSMFSFIQQGTRRGWLPQLLLREVNGSK